MRLLVLLGCMTLVISTAIGKEPPKDRIRLFRPLKDKRGAADHSSGYPPFHPYNLNGFSLQNFAGHNLGGYSSSYNLPTSTLNAGLGHGFNLSPGLGHTSSYPTSGLFTQLQSKNGPVTFANAGPTSPSSLYVTTAMQDLAKYLSSGSHGIQFLVTSPTPQSDPHHVKGSNLALAGYQSPLATAGDSTGAYVLANPSHESPYLVSMSSPSSSHAVSSYSSSAPSSSYNSHTSHIGLSSGSSDSSSYSLPISASSYPVSASSGSKRFVPVSSAGSTYATPNSISSSASYSLPGAGYEKSSSPTYSNSGEYASVPGYATVSKNYAEVPSSNYPSNYPGYSSSNVNTNTAYVSSGSQQAVESTGHAASSSNASPAYSKTISSYFANPSASYTDPNANYPPGYSSQASYATPSESVSASNLVARYLSYAMERPSDNASSGGSNYDTISYSTASGKNQ